MFFSYSFVVGVLALMPLAATAQQTQQPHPADANAAVPAFGYTSAFNNYRSTPEGQDAPDKVWRFANKEMERLGGHAGHMKDTGSTTVASPSGNSGDNAQSGKNLQPAMPSPSTGQRAGHGAHHSGGE